MKKKNQTTHLCILVYIKNMIYVKTNHAYILLNGSYVNYIDVTFGTTLSTIERNYFAGNEQMRTSVFG